MRKLLLGLLICLPARPETLRLDLKQAVDLALAPQGSARVELAREMTRQAELRSRQARAALLPDFSGTIGYQDQTRNLAAFGIRLNLPIPGFTSPELVGPFSVFDIRAGVTQSVFNFSSIRRYQASRTAVEAARSDNESTRVQVAEQVARAYIAALRSRATVETARANISLAEALVRLAGSHKTAGTGTGIEVVRAQVQLANERQRLLVAENERQRADLQLLRAIGLKLDAAVELGDVLVFRREEEIPEAKAIEMARRGRPEWSAQEKREQSARLSASAVRMERLPSLAGFADYGSIGSSPANAIPTRTYGLSLRVPVWDGGRRDARRAESVSLYRQEQTRTRDLGQQLELEVRLALDSLRSAEAQVKVAEEGLELADRELAQARRRYEAGVAPGIEVTDAQTRLQRARENRVAALFNHNLARVDFARATGTMEPFVASWK